MLQKCSRPLALLVAAVLVVASCGGDASTESSADGDTSSTTAAPTTATTEAPDGAEATGSAGGGDPDDTGGDTEDDSAAADGSADTDGEGSEPERIDWLTFARGMTFVSLSGLQSGSASNGLKAVDGDGRTYGVTDDVTTVEFVYELPASTTLDRLAVPNILDRPGNDTALRFLTVEGSAEGPDAGWMTLADAEFELHDEEGQVTELEMLEIAPIRWLRLTMSGGVFVEPGDEGKTIVRFSELIGNGTQEPVTETADFAGLWEFDLTERPDLSGKPLQITQTGSTISGCWADVVFNGSVNGAIARASGVDVVRDRPAAFIFVADVDDGSVTALVSENGGFFKPYITSDNPEITGCLTEEAPEPVICETSAYINFDVNSATIRPESMPVLADLYDLLVADGAANVSIVGHTSTEGDADYNLGLSERRAQAVVDDLVGRGFDAAAISAEGRGETQPLVSPDDTESAREINRRVDILCG